MKVLGVCVAMALLPLAARAGDPKNGADFVQPMLDRLGKMGSTEQQVWLQQLEKRASRAAQLTLSPADAARQQGKIRSQLHQSVISWQMLRDAIEDTNRQEKDAIDRLVRRYRGLVFDNFHKQLDVYGQRQQAWPDIYLDWKLAGSRFEQQGLLIDWLELAIRSVTPGTIGAIPEKPKFDGVKKPGTAADPPAKTDTKPAQPALLPSSSMSPADPTVRTAAKVPTEAVEVKVDELAARIGGSNLALRALEIELDEKGDWTAARLEPLADRLKILVLRRNDLHLFREAVVEDKRAAIESLASPKGLVSQLAGRIAEARGKASGASFRGTDAERHAELQRLDDLSRRLAELAGK